MSCLGLFKSFVQLEAPLLLIISISENVIPGIQEAGKFPGIHQPRSRNYRDSFRNHAEELGGSPDLVSNQDVAVIDGLCI